MVVAKVDLDLIYPFQDLLRVGPDNIEAACVVIFMQEEILLKICNLHIQFCQPNFHVNPDGDNPQQKGKKTNCLGKRKAQYV